MKSRRDRTSTPGATAAEERVTLEFASTEDNSVMQERLRVERDTTDIASDQGHDQDVGSTEAQLAEGSPESVQRDDSAASAAIDALLPRIPEGMEDLLTPDFFEGLVLGIYTAEDALMGNPEKWAELFGLGDTVGPGQISEAAYDDVMAQYESESEKFLAAIDKESMPSWRPASNWPPYFHFIAAGYLLLNIDAAWNKDEARSAADAIKYGIGTFHSRNPIVDAQEASDQTTEFDPIWEHLDDEYKTYIHTVYQSGRDHSGQHDA